MTPQGDRLYSWVRRLFFTGLGLSLTLILLGFILLGVKGTPVTDSAVPLSRVLGQTLRFDPLAMLSLGILALLFTPVLRLVLVLVGFLLERDRGFVAISLIVLGIIAVSILLAAR